jgi:hypothetical protein
LAVQSEEFAAADQPWPLQAFCPLQALLAPLQALWPLQALVPPQWTSAAKAAVAKVLAAKIEAAVAMMVRFVMSWLRNEFAPTTRRSDRASLRSAYVPRPITDLHIVSNQIEEKFTGP